jgi:hypothetical protein
MLELLATSGVESPSRALEETMMSLDYLDL